MSVRIVHEVVVSCSGSILCHETFSWSVSEGQTTREAIESARAAAATHGWGRSFSCDLCQKCSADYDDRMRSLP